MPNWVRNIINLEGKSKNINKVLKYVRSEDSLFDFNKIIPMPESLNVECGSSENDAIVVYISEKFTKDINTVKLSPFSFLLHNMFEITYNRVKTKIMDEELLDELYEKGKIYCSNYEKFGATEWYDWCCKNWGCKWNASEIYIDKNQIIFETPWSCPIGVLGKFAEICKNNDVKFTGCFADEDRGYNSGYFSENDINFNENTTSDAYETYVKCWGELPCIYLDENGRYYHYECDSCPHRNERCF